MKKVLFITLCVSIALFSLSCEKLFDKEKPDELRGDPSPMGAVGTTISSGDYEELGATDFSAVVTEQDGDISTYSASAKITNTLLKNLVANFPGVTINGDNVSITDMKVQQTTEGIKSLTGPGAGVIVKYGSDVGDTYPIGNTGKERKVVSKSDVDDYPYGFYLIKTMQVEMEPVNLKSGTGVQKYTFIANHRFGLVGVKVNFDDGTDQTFPVFSSAEND